jgi:CheY-like chemotaxis protein
MSEDFGTTILLVEDNEDDVFIIKRALKLAQNTNPLQIVTDGQQALDYLAGAGEYADRQKFPLPFMVFLDLKLPYIHGFEVLAWMRLRPELSSLVVVVLTSSAETRDHEKAYALGARSYLVKPPTPQALSDVFGSLKTYWLSKGSSLPLSTSANG